MCVVIVVFKTFSVLVVITLKGQQSTSRLIFCVQMSCDCLIQFEVGFSGTCNIKSHDYISDQD